MSKGEVREEEPNCVLSSQNTRFYCFLILLYLLHLFISILFFLLIFLFSSSFISSITASPSFSSSSTYPLIFSAVHHCPSSAFSCLFLPVPSSSLSRPHFIPSSTSFPRSPTPSRLNPPLPLPLRHQVRTCVREGQVRLNELLELP